ncbi:HlyD family secretion protein [Vibrio cholerae]|uniref:HlyD family secretion protein n=1 Tax=Vibrio cholerae TaxID=666 RepID=UPI00301D4492
MKVKFHLDKQHQPQSERGMKVMYGQAKRGGYRLRWYLILALVISPLLAMGYYLYRDKVLVIAPAIVTSKPVAIKATEDGVIGPLNLVVGQSVTEQQALFEVTNTTLANELDFMRQEIAQLNVNQEENTHYHTLAIENTQRNSDQIQQIRKRYEMYKAKGQVSDVDYAAIINLAYGAQNELNSRNIALNDAQTSYQERLLAGPISQAKRGLMKELVVKQSQLERLNIHSPFDGRVVALPVVEGQQVEKGDPLVVIAKNITPQVTAYLNPKYLDVSQFGTHAKVIFPDGKTFSATVSEAVEIVSKLPIQLAKPFEGKPAYMEVTLTFDEELEENRWIEGMTVEVEF